jgi:hypothetical protein
MHNRQKIKAKEELFEKLNRLEEKGTKLLSLSSWTTLNRLAS